MDEKLSIRVNIADRYYPLKIERDDEERIRKASKLINDKIMLYKQSYRDKDTQDFLAMAALQFVIKMIENENNTDVAPFIDQLTILNNELADYLNRGE